MAQILNLELHSGLSYFKAGGFDPFAIEKDQLELGKEFVFKFERGADGTPEKLLEIGYESADAYISSDTSSDLPESKIDIPDGKYFFAQEKNVLTKEKIVCQFKEIEKHAKNCNINLEPECFLRYINEHGKNVTQFFCGIRDIKENSN